MLGTMGTLPSSGPTTAPGGVSAPSVPQFEPVSPDDEDQTPPLINMEGARLFSLISTSHPHPTHTPPTPSLEVLVAIQYLLVTRQFVL